MSIKLTDLEVGIRANTATLTKAIQVLDKLVTNVDKMAAAAERMAAVNENSFSRVEKAAKRASQSQLEGSDKAAVANAKLERSLKRTQGEMQRLANSIRRSNVDSSKQKKLTNELVDAYSVYQKRVKSAGNDQAQLTRAATAYESRVRSVKGALTEFKAEVVQTAKEESVASAKRAEQARIAAKAMKDLEARQKQIAAADKAAKRASEAHNVELRKRRETSSAVAREISRLATNVKLANLEDKESQRLIRNLVTARNSYNKVLRNASSTTNDVRAANDRYRTALSRVSNQLKVSTQQAAANRREQQLLKQKHLENVGVLRLLAIRMKASKLSADQAAAASAAFSHQMTNLSKSVQVALGPLSGVASRITALSALFNRNTALVAGLVGGLIGLGAAYVKVLKSGAEFEKQMAVISNRIRVLGVDVGFTSGQLNEMAIKLGRDTLASAQGARNAILLLMDAAGLQGDQFRRVLGISQDLAELGYGNLEQNSRKLARAIRDPETGLERLQSLGIRVTSAFKNTAIALKQAGEETALISLILSSFTKIEGTASAAGTGLAGAVDSLGEAFTTLFERISTGEGVMGPITEQINKLTAAVDELSTTQGGLDALQGIARAMTVIGKALLVVAPHLDKVVIALATIAGLKGLLAMFGALKSLFLVLSSSAVITGITALGAALKAMIVPMLPLLAALAAAAAAVAGSFVLFGDKIDFVNEWMKKNGIEAETLEGRYEALIDVMKRFAGFDVGSISTSSTSLNTGPLKNIGPKEKPTALAITELSDTGEAIAKRYEKINNTLVKQKAIAKALLAGDIKRVKNIEASSKAEALRIEIKKQVSELEETDLALLRERLDFKKDEIVSQETIVEKLADQVEQEDKLKQLNKERTKEIEDNVKKIGEAVKELGNGVEEALADGINNVLTGADNKFSDFFKNLVTNAKRSFADMAASLLRTKFIAPIEAQITQSLVSAVAPSLGAAASAAGGGGVIGGLSNLGSLSALTKFLPDSVTSFGSSALSGISATLFGKGAVGALGPQLPTAGLIGSGGNFLGISGGIGGLFGAAGAGGLGGLASSFLGLGNQNGLISGASSAVGGIIGTAALSGILGPAAPFVGGFVGSALSGLFGGGSSVGPNAGGQLRVNGEQFFVGPTGADNGGNVGPIIQALEAASDALNLLTALPGISVDQSKKPFGAANPIAGSINTFGSGGIRDATDLVQSVVSKGIIAGLDAAEKEIIAQAENAGEAIQQIIERQLAKEAFGTNLSAAITQLEDPRQYAIDQVEIEIAALKAQAEAFGILNDVVDDIDRLRDLKMKEVLERFADNVDNTTDRIQKAAEDLQNFISGILGGSSSFLPPQLRLGFAQARFDELLSPALSGDVDAVRDIQTAASNLIDVNRELFASSSEFFTAFNTIVAQLMAVQAVLSTGSVTPTNPTPNTTPPANDNNTQQPSGAPAPTGNVDADILILLSDIRNELQLTRIGEGQQTALLEDLSTEITRIASNIV